MRSGRADRVPDLDPPERSRLDTRAPARSVMHQILPPVLAVAVLLVSVSFLVPLAERLRIPHTVLLAALGVTVGTAGLWLGSGWGVLSDLLLGFG